MLIQYCDIIKHILFFDYLLYIVRIFNNIFVIVFVFFKLCHINNRLLVPCFALNVFVIFIIFITFVE